MDYMHSKKEGDKMRESQKKLILMDCKIIMNKLGDIPFDLSYNSVRKEFCNIGNKYGLSGPEVFDLFMRNFPKKGGENE